uniref:Lipoprotein n=1 Tax=Geobacter sp. (strain M21) TaxID=443144 RepID=C6E5F9_GEOSM
MRTFLKLALLAVAISTLFGCAHNYYNIPQETLEKKVKTIGVAPIFVDPDSDIRHPDKDAIVSLVRTYNARNEKELIARLRGTGIFYAVRQVDGDPARLFSTLVWNKEKRDDAGIIYNKYFLKKDELTQLMTDNGLDAVLFLTVSGLTRQGKVFSSNYLSYLDTDFNYLVMTAQMIDREGNTVWEYPNFRRASLSFPLFFPLQYPDFDEAAANLSEKVDVKFKTVAGVNAAFAKTEASAIANAPEVSVLYARQFDEMLALLKTYKPLFAKEKEKEIPAPVSVPSGYAPAKSAAPVVAPVAPQPAAATAPATAAPAAPAAPAPLNSAPVQLAPGEIVPEEPPAK